MTYQLVGDSWSGMKSRTLAVLLVMLSTVCGAFGQARVKLKSLRLPDGKVLENVELWKENESEANYSYKGRGSSGFGLVEMSKLPPEVQSRLGYKPDAEAAKKLAEKEEQELLKSSPTIQSVSMRAKTGSAGRSTTTSWKTSWGSYEKEIDQERALALSIRNGMDKRGVVYVEVIWLTNGADGKGPAVGVSSINRQRILLAPRETITGTVTSSFGRTDNNYAALGIRQVAGKGFAGWVVRVVDPESGKVIASEAMREPLKVWSDKIKVAGKASF